MGAVGAEPLLPAALRALPGLLGSAAPVHAGFSLLAALDVPGGMAFLAQITADPRGAVPTVEAEGINRKSCVASQQLPKPPPTNHILHHQGNRSVP